MKQVEAFIKVLIENVWNTFLISAYDMARFFDDVGSPWVQVHFDIGNMMRWGVAEHWAQVLGKRSVVGQNQLQRLGRRRSQSR